MSETVRLGLPLIAAAQAQKHVTHNEALVALDALACLSIIDRDLADPPAEAAEGAAYIVAAPATGVWEGEEGRIAFRLDGGWRFYAPFAGLTAHVADEGALIVHDGAGWITAGGGTPEELQNLALFGLGTAADAVNPFSAVLNKALWAARRVADGGDGDLRYTLSKEGAGDVLSMLFQTDFSARAEFGLIGDDDLVFKVSPDGESWSEAMRLEAATGKAAFPAGVAGLREQLSGDRTYYVRTDGSDANDGLSDSAGRAFATIQRAVDVVAGLDLGGFTVTVRVGPGTYPAGAALKPLVGGECVIVGDEANPANVEIAVTGNADAFALIGHFATYRLRGMKIRSSGGTVTRGIHANTGVVYFRALDFGSFPAASGSRHVYAAGSALVEAEGNYAISGGAGLHWFAEGTSQLRAAGKDIALTGTPAFAIRFAQAGGQALMTVNNNTFSGSATGMRYWASGKGFISVNGAGGGYLPGDAAGAVQQGGLYA